MVEGAIRWVSSWQDYLNASTSTLNPHNQGFGFYVYGTLPLLIVRGFMEFVRHGNMDNYHMIGRWMSVCSEMGAGLCAVYTSYRLFGRHAALISAVLCSFSVLSIQNAHFGTVDSLLGFLCTAALLIGVQITYVSTDGIIPLLYCLLFGLVSGSATATKINAGLVVVLLPLALCVARLSWRTRIAGCVLGGMTALLAFRILQPYAFAAGPLWNVSLNPKWTANLAELKRLSALSLGFPPAVQWLERSQLFGIWNLFRWSLGPPVALIVVVGIEMILRDEWRNRTFNTLPVLVWCVIATVTYGIIPSNPTQRYLLPVIPAYFICAGGGIVMLFNEVSRRTPRWKPLLGLLTGSTLAYAAAWGIGFSTIYSQKHSRIAASEWILTHIPGAVNVVGTTSGEAVTIPLMLSTPAGRPLRSGMSLTGTITPTHQLAVHAISLPKLIISGAAASLVATVESSVGDSCLNPVSEISIPADQSAATIPLRCIFAEGKPYTIRVSLKSESIVSVLLPRIVHETAWDDGLPLRVLGYDPYGGIYEGSPNPEIYSPDNSEKLALLARTLATNDYFFITSNRQFGSVGRLPHIFPITQRFYRSLLSCDPRTTVPGCYYEAEPTEKPLQLGYSLRAVFTSFPTFFGYPINDQYAEEAFSVYDHPMVLLFQNTAHLSEAQIAHLLEAP